MPETVPPVTPVSRLTQPVVVALIGGFFTVVGVTIPLIFLQINKVEVKVAEVHELVNAKATAQDSTIRALAITIKQRDSTVARLIEMMGEQAP